MSIKILTITHRNFSSLFYEVMEMLNLPMELKVLEIEFGQVGDYIETDEISKYDLVITSGAHLDMINKDFYELTYIVPFYPLQFTEADLVTAIVKSKEYGKNVILMYVAEQEYELDKYKDLLDINLIRVPIKNLDEAKKLILEYKRKGFNAVIGTSSICETAKKLDFPNVLVYSLDSLKLELIKAYQLAATKKKMMEFAKFKEVIVEQLDIPIYLLDHEGLIIDVNSSGIEYGKKRMKHELIGESIDTILEASLNMTLDQNKDDQKQIVSNNGKVITTPIYLNEKLNGYIMTIAGENKWKNMKVNQNNKTLNSKYDFKDIVHQSASMKKVIVKAKQYAESEAPIFIFGESGTGKELIAHSIHRQGKREAFPFLPVNCSAIPQHILESELFGYEEGAFTGAKKGGKPGFFEMAQGGSIFLDEIGEIPLELQTKLLRVLQEKEVIRLGGKNIIPLDVRIITATNKSLPKLIKEKSFREDLYYRINVLKISIPPLRERLEDTLIILKHLLIKHGMDSSQADHLIKVGQDNILSYKWPGNIRELENFSLRITALASLSNTTYDLVKTFNDTLKELISLEGEMSASLRIEQKSFISQTSSMDIVQLEKSRIINALVEFNGNKNKASEKLGISRTTLWRKLKELNIN